MSLEFDPIDEVLESLRQGRPIIVTDDANRENEGDLTIAAENVRRLSVIWCSVSGRSRKRFQIQAMR